MTAFSFPFAFPFALAGAVGLRPRPAATVARGTSADEIEVDRVLDTDTGDERNDNRGAGFGGGLSAFQQSMATLTSASCLLIVR